MNEYGTSVILLRRTPPQWLSVIFTSASCDWIDTIKGQLYGGGWEQDGDGDRRIFPETKGSCGKNTKDGMYKTYRRASQSRD